MGELHELTGTMCALKNVEEVELVGMPKLKRCTLMGAFKSVKSVKMENAGKFESKKELKEAMEEEKRRKEEEIKRQEEEEKEKKREEERRQREEQERNREMEEWKREMEERMKRKMEERMKREMEEWKRKDNPSPLTQTNDADIVVLERKTVTIKSGNSLDNANCYIGIIVIASNCCNETGLKMLNLKRFLPC